MLSGSLSTCDMVTLTLLVVGTLSSISFLNTRRNPLSVFVCSHNTTAIPLEVASKTSWCDISPIIIINFVSQSLYISSLSLLPVKYTSALIPCRTLAPEPTHTAKDEASFPSSHSFDRAILI